MLLESAEEDVRTVDLSVTNILLDSLIHLELLQNNFIESVE